MHDSDEQNGYRLVLTHSRSYLDGTHKTFEMFLLPPERPGSSWFAFFFGANHYKALTQVLEFCALWGRCLVEVFLMFCHGSCATVLIICFTLISGKLGRTRRDQSKISASKGRPKYVNQSLLSPRISQQLLLFHFTYQAMPDRSWWLIQESERDCEVMLFVEVISSFNLIVVGS